MSTYYSDSDDVDIRVSRRRAPVPSPVHYVEARPTPRSYYPSAAQPSYLIPERTTISTRTRSRERSRDRRSSPPSSAAPAPPPVIINNRIYNEHSSDEEDDRHMQVYRSSRHRSHSRANSHSHSRSPSSSYMTREEFEAERARSELAELRITQARDKEETRVQRQYREEAELQRVRRDLDEIQRREAREKEDQRFKTQIELERYQEEMRQAELDKKRQKEEKRFKTQLELEKYQEELRQADLAKKREKEAADAVERYKKKEADRIAKEKQEQEQREKEFQRRLQEERQKELDRQAKEKKEREEREKEYQQRLQNDLIKSGLDEKAIAAILKKEKIPVQKQKQPAPAAPPLQALPPADNGQRPTYTRMARRHLSIETLRTHRVEWELDVDPEYVLIKRWVPEWEQDTLWRHTKLLRESRSSKMVLQIEDKPRRHEPEFEWVRKKSDRKRSKSPALLMYLAGAKPA